MVEPGDFEVQSLGLAGLQTRAQWGARPPNYRAADEGGWFDPRRNPGGWLVYDDPAHMLTTVVVHHTALGVEIDAVAIQRLHMDKRGLADIAYHLVIDAEGLVFEGRRLNVRGAHVRGANTGTVGVVLLGNFEKHTPTQEQVTTLHQVVGALKRRFGGITHVAGHRDFNDETVCPGRFGAMLLPPLATAHGLALGTGGYRRPDWA